MATIRRCAISASSTASWRAASSARARRRTGSLARAGRRGRARQRARTGRRRCRLRERHQLGPAQLEGWQFINPDLTIALQRHPVDEWVCLEAETMVQSSGIGLAESRLWDRVGRLGRAVQSLVIDRD